MHTRSNVLDVVRAVTRVAPAHPQVATWWYVPRFLENPRIELLVEVEVGQPADLPGIARAIEAHLTNASVTVAHHPGPGETRRLFRILSRSASSHRQPA
jgi:hypothetical protein